MGCCSRGGKHVIPSALATDSGCRSRSHGTRATVERRPPTCVRLSAQTGQQPSSTTTRSLRCSTSSFRPTSRTTADVPIQIYLIYRAFSCLIERVLVWCAQRLWSEHVVQ